MLLRVEHIVRDTVGDGVCEALNEPVALGLIALTVGGADDRQQPLNILPCQRVGVEPQRAQHLHHFGTIDLDDRRPQDREVLLALFLAHLGAVMKLKLSEAGEAVQVQPLGCEPGADELRDLHRSRADQRRLLADIAVHDLVDDAAELGLFGLEDDVRMVLPHHRPVRWHNQYRHAVDGAEFVLLGLGGTGHPR